MSDTALPTTSPSFSTELPIPIATSLPPSSHPTTQSSSADPYPFPPPVSTKLVKSTTADGGKLINDFRLLTPLGEGAYATVTLAQHTMTGQLVAMKKMSKSKLSRVKEYMVGGGGGGGGGRPMLARPRMMTALDKVRKEIAIMQQLRCEHVVRLLALIDDDDQDALYLVLEAADKGQIMDWDGDSLTYRSRVLPSSPHGGIQEAMIRPALLDLLTALDYLHSQHIVHRDVKPDNLLLFSNPALHTGYTAKLADFGVARQLNDGELLTETQGTYHFYAPEMCSGEKYDAWGQDVWAVGVTLFILCTGRAPWMSKDNNPAELFELIANAPSANSNTITQPGASMRDKCGICCSLQPLTDRLSPVTCALRAVRRLVFPDGCEVSGELKDLIVSILEKDPKKRLTLRDIRCHPWVSSAGDDSSSRYAQGSVLSAVLTAAVMASKEEEEQKVSPTATNTG